MWGASPPSALAPELSPDTDSELPFSTVRDLLVAHLRTAAPAWDPTAPRG